MATVSRGGTREKFRFIHRYGQALGVCYLCDWLAVSPSGFYAWRNRSTSQRVKDDERLLRKIRQIYHESRGTYGSPRVFATLKRQGISIGRKRVERLMQADGLQGRVVKVTRRQPGLKRFRATGENLLLNIPHATRVNQIWVADITYTQVKGQYKLITTIMDQYSRRILGWSLSSTRTVDDTLKVLKRVIKHRQPPKELIFHTDRGIEFTGLRFRDVLMRNKLLSSVNRLGVCTDNAYMESFYHTLKAELIRGRHFNTMKELRHALNSYINQFYNHKRLHSGIGYNTPAEYERMAA